MDQAFNSKIEKFASWGVFCTLLVMYWLTVPPTVSYWDCPEYVAAAWKLEVGHPPGNPVWMLVERVVTMLAPSGKYAALLINLSSGLFTALAGFLLTKSVWLGGGWIMQRISPRRWPNLTLGVASAVAGLAFGLSDSAWYSAVEAEVYALSIFMTALCVWVMIKWSFCSSASMSARWLILLAYLFGLSVGIHQLNLLCIPALAIVWSIKRQVRVWWKVAFIFFLSLVAVGCVLAGMMPSTIALAAQFELFFVNRLHLPFLSGVVAYVALLGISLVVALIVTGHSRNRGGISMAIFPPLFLSGLFIFSGHFAVGAAVSALIAILSVRGQMFSPRRLNIAVWMLALLLTGYSSYAIIPIRGGIPSPANPARPGDPFSFAAYQAREQYGASPLLHGNTPYSKHMLQEDSPSKPGGTPSYTRTILEPQHPVISAKIPGGKIRDPYGKLTAEDSAMNRAAFSHDGDAYIVRSYTVKPYFTPELDMWFPRITSRDPEDLPFFNDWVGMNPETMTQVNISETVDSLGQPVPRMGADGKRIPTVSYRPTYLQSLQMFLTYQTGYMYFRYLMWNFCGRQNDYHSTGEVEHGNFITGFPVIDNAMLGAEEALPPHLGANNKGRNVYYMLPLIFGLFGIIWLLYQGKRGRKVNLMLAMLFVMSGLAIVVYLNQSPGEARERDYSFLGSFWAYAAWIGFGAMGFIRLWSRRAPVMAAIPVAMVVWMGCVNFDDHDRSGRRAASNITANILNSLPQDAIIFVNGDNSTFPLWYAQEVEGIRKDVRVVNLAYLSVPMYVEALTHEWDGAKPLAMTLQPKDYLYGALQFTKISSTPSDTIVSPRKALSALAANSEAVLPYSRVWLKTSPKDSVVFPLRTLSKSERGSLLDFKRLVVFDIITANIESAQPRPVFWMRNLPTGSYAGLMPHTDEHLFCRQYGGTTPDYREQAYLAALEKMLPANDTGREVYMDMIPAGQAATMRTALLLGARDMLSHKRLSTALKLAVAADQLPGRDLRSFTAVRVADSTFNIRNQMPLIFREIADAVDAAQASQPHSQQGKRNCVIPDAAIAATLRQRADSIESEGKLLIRQLTDYRNALPERLRGKMSH